jgi:hypothetical protein
LFSLNYGIQQRKIIVAMGNSALQDRPDMGRKSTDRHKPSFTVRLPQAFEEPLDALVDANPGTDRTEFVRHAVQEYLAKRGLWTSSFDAKDDPK